MSKSKRLIELMMTVNRMRKFTVKELADQFGVSARTILRDLQELSELGVPLYSEVGPHGGYQVLRERILPPIAFSEEEAVAMFFASHALRHYLFLPFEAESSAALQKFYYYMPGDVRDRIDEMKNRVDFLTHTRKQKAAFLGVLLDAAVEQRVVSIQYETKQGLSERSIQPVGIYASNGFWYCPAYCFMRGDFRLFRCDRMHSAAFDESGVEPLDHRYIHLGNWREFAAEKAVYVRMIAELTREGVQRCEAELCPVPRIDVKPDGSGRLDQEVPTSEMRYFAKFFLGLGNEAVVLEPKELVDSIRDILRELTEKYGQGV
ncbi:MULTISPECIES: helix-turn-helix transcriptional regulator [Paenibacillus]|uniref:Regulatory protein DeoR n=2 Tax=Paenibacillus lactis TaxID=228574 RepID=G4HK67_9BACL|nr:YafY family protein [Paenibacillus lactis]EHB62268.1 regulatory protein DeoR [Paenibacillus lactis 154]MBP1895621.1 putative DNA-binding transcriptional regulator YafY [Paenibacillus lactis]HAG00050.1 YafY family transcriptional regulator [Paenibacillus lactis]